MRRFSRKGLSIIVGSALSLLFVVGLPQAYFALARSGEVGISAAISSSSVVKKTSKPIKTTLVQSENVGKIKKTSAAFVSSSAALRTPTRFGSFDRWGTEGALRNAGRTSVSTVAGSSFIPSSSGDSYVARALSSANFSADPILKSGSVGKEAFKTFLKFDISSLSGYTVTSADLALYASDSRGKSDVTVGLPVADWSEAGITWEKQPAVAFLGTTSVKRGQWAHFSLGRAVQETLSGSRPDYGFAIDSKGYKEFASKESSDVSRRPCLTVTYDYPSEFDLLSPVDGAHVSAVQPRFSWSQSGNVDHYQLWVDGILAVDGIPKAQTWVRPAVSLSEGNHTWFVRAVNNVGDFTRSTSTRAVIVDTVAPTTMLTADPISPDGQNGWYKSAPSILMSSSDPGSTYYQWDSTSTAGWASYVGGMCAPEGEHALYYYSVDVAKNAEAVRETVVRVDSTAPSSLISTPVDGARLAGAYQNVAGTAFDKGSGLLCVEVSTDGGATWEVASGTSTWGYDWICQDDGAYRIESRAFDRAGNVEQPATGLSVSVDLLPVTMLSTSPALPDGANGWFRTNTRIILSSSQPGTTYVQWDSTETSGWTAYAGDLSAVQGIHTLYYYSVDLQGNAEKVKSYAIKADSSEPAAFGLNIPTDGMWSSMKRPSISWQESADTVSGLAGYRMYLDGDLAVDGIAPSITSMRPGSDLSEGIHSVCVEAFDAAGNRYRSAARSVGIDTVSPVAFDLVSPADGASVDEGRPLFSWTASLDSGSGLAGYQVFIDDALTVDGISPNAMSAMPAVDLKLGRHSWFVKAEDAAGNAVSSPARNFYVVDLSYPAATEMAPTGTVNSRTPVISAKLADSWTGVDGASTSMKLDGINVIPIYEPITGYVSYSPIANLETGKHSVEVAYSDYAGNRSVAAWDFTVFGTEVSGIISQDTTWTAAGGPYIMESNITVDAGATLTVEPGTVIKLLNSALTINGGLVAGGTEQQPIYATSLKDDSIGGDTNGDGSATSPAPGDWVYLKCSNGSFGKVSHLNVRFAGNGLWIDGASPEITRSSISDCLSSGICLSGTSAPLISDSVIERNNMQPGVFGAGIDIGGAARPHISGCTIENNGAPNDPDGHGISSSSTGPLTITGNVITGNQGDAIVQSGNGPVAITNNRISGNADHAVRLNVNAPILDASANEVAGNKYNGIRLNGTLSTNKALEPYSGLPYILVGGSAVSVISGASLTLEPGTVVKFEGAGSQGLVINGSLNIVGAPSNRVRLTSIKDDSIGGDTNGDGAATVPAKNDWGYVRFTPGSKGSIDNATIRYGYYGVFADSASPSISHSAIEDCFLAGICLNGSASSVVGNVISNSQYGVYILGFANPKVNGNDFANNATYDLYNASSITIDATDNYWGKHPYQVGDFYSAVMPSAYNYTVDQNGIVTGIAVISAPWATTPFWLGTITF